LTTNQNDLIDLSHKADQDEIKNLKEKNIKLEGLLSRCKDAIKTSQAKQDELVKIQEDLNQRLIEKESIIDSMMREKNPGSTNGNSKHFESENAVLLKDKEHLLEQLESARFSVQQLESELEKTKQKQITDEEQKQKRNDDIITIDEREDDLAKRSVESAHLQMLSDGTERESDLLKQKLEELEEQKYQNIQLKMSVDEHIQQINVLTTTIETLKTDLDERQQEINDQKSLIQTLNGTINDFQVKYDELTKNIEQDAKDREEQDHLREKVNLEHQQNIDSVKLEFQKKLDEQQAFQSGNVDKLKQEYDTLIKQKDEEIQSFTQRLSSEQTRCMSLEETIENVKKEYSLSESDLKTKIANQQADIDRLVEERMRLTDEISSIKNVLSNIDLDSSKSDSITENIQCLSNEIIRLRVQSDNCRHELHSFFDNDTEYGEISKMIVQMKDSYFKMEEKSLKYEHEIDELQKSVDRWKQINEDEETNELKKLQEEIDLLKNEKKEKQVSLDELKLNVLQKESDISQLSEKCEQQEVTIDNLKKNVKHYEIRSTEEEIVVRMNYKKDIEKLENEIDTLKETSNNEQKRYIELANQTDTMKNEYENKINQLTTELKEQMEKIQKLDEITNLQISLDNVSKERDAIRQKYDELKQTTLVKQQEYEQQGTF
ncbi:unnamed protein product, partial [Didymodactylos carnosus]